MNNVSVNMVKDVCSIIFPSNSLKNVIFEEKMIKVDFSEFVASFFVMGNSETEYTLFINDENSIVNIKEIGEINPVVHYTFSLLNTNPFLTSVDSIKSVHFNIEKNKVKSYIINFNSNFFKHLGVHISDKKTFICVDGSMFNISVSEDIMSAYNKFINNVLFNKKYKSSKFQYSNIYQKKYKNTKLCNVTVEELSRYMQEENILPSELSEFNFELIQMINI